MGDPSATTERISGTLRRTPGVPRSRAWRLFATLPFAIAWGVAAVTMNASLAPAHDMGEQLRMQHERPAPPAESSPVHHDEAVFDPSELISV